MRFASTAAALVLTVSSAQAATVDIDLNDFIYDFEVTVSPDGSSASFVESDITPIYLYTSPFDGTPNVILPGVGTTLTFDYDFVEAAGNDDEFSAYLFDDDTGDLIDAAFEFYLDSSGSGSISFDLSTLIGTTLGLEFALTALPGDGNMQDSTLTISNVQLTSAMAAVPLPASGLLLLGGLAAMGARRKAKT